jgi:hypothetical protein
LFEFSRGRHFEGWQEGLITFSPTYKYQPNSDQYYWCFDSAQSEKKRAPAWSAQQSHTTFFSRRSFEKKKAFFSRTIKKEQAKPYTLNPASMNLWSGECDLRPIEVFTFLCAGAIAFCGEARD